MAYLMIIFNALVLLPMSGTLYAKNCKTLKSEDAPWMPIENKSSYPKASDPQLLIAAWMGDLPTAKCLIRKGAKVDEKGFRGDTALMRASFFCRADMVKLLVQSKAKVNTVNLDGQNALYFLCNMEPKSENVLKVLNSLLRRVRNINQLDKNGKPAIANLFTYALSHKSSFPNHRAAVIRMIDAGAKVKGLDLGAGLTPLVLSINRDDFDMVKRVVRAGADVNAVRNGRTPLDAASRLKDKRIYNFLVSKGAGKPKKKKVSEGWASKIPPVVEVKEAKWKGKKVYIKPESMTKVRVYKTQDFSKENVLGWVKGNTKATIVEVVAYTRGDITLSRNFKLRLEDGREGWVRQSDLLCTSMFCNDKHPQRTFPFKL